MLKYSMIHFKIHALHMYYPTISYMTRQMQVKPFGPGNGHLNSSTSFM